MVTRNFFHHHIVAAHQRSSVSYTLPIPVMYFDGGGVAAIATKKICFSRTVVTGHVKGIFASYTLPVCVMYCDGEVIAMLTKKNFLVTICGQRQLVIFLIRCIAYLGNVFGLGGGRRRGCDKNHFFTIRRYRPRKTFSRTLYIAHLRNLFRRRGDRHGGEKITPPHVATAHVNISFYYLTHCLSPSYYERENVAARLTRETLFITGHGHRPRNRLSVSYTLLISARHFDREGIAVVTKNFFHHCIWSPPTHGFCLIHCLCR